MPTIEEMLSGGGTALHDALATGIADISHQQVVTFSIYTRAVLPLDGYVFWLRTGEFTASGSIHWLSDRRQEEAETATHNSVVFTTTAPLTELNERNTQSLIIGDIDGMRYGFTRNGWFYPPASIWHYTGDALVPSEATQLIDYPDRLDTTTLIVSNSLPAWLKLYSYRPIWLAPLNPGIQLYPSFLVPDNLRPPYGSVHIEPDTTMALQTAPWLDRNSSHYQLTSEDVRITLYGCNNNQAEDLLDLIERYSYDWNVIGIMNMPTVRDGKRPSAGTMTIAQQKFIDVKVSYVQTRINDLARQMILEACLTVLTPCMLYPRTRIAPAATATAFADVF